jgi:penicillin-insensitive murein endopeptidase
MAIGRTPLVLLACCGLVAASAAFAASAAKRQAATAKSVTAKSAVTKSKSAHAHPAKPEPPAKQLFGAKTLPTVGAPRAIGFYAKGCLAGARELPTTGKTWQVMRLSRNRNWGHPNLIAFIERFSAKVPKVSTWPGILIGDMAQPRGGPMVNGHASHQIGLDVDIWFTPMPAHKLTVREREDTSAQNVVAANRKDVKATLWGPSYAAVVKAAAQDDVVARIFVNPAIKYEFCKQAGSDRGWLHKVRPYWGHDDHFHVRLRCPAGHSECTGQPPPPAGDGCASENFKYWFSEGVLHPKPHPPGPPRHQITLSELPAACRQVLAAPNVHADAHH